MHINQDIAVKAKAVIDKIQQQKLGYSSPESAQDQANSLESLSSDIYTDSKRFLYELLQNADDASCDSGKLEVYIKIIDDFLCISHNGEPFSEVDVESICSVGDGNKKEDDNKTGFKGIGFKSVFAHSYIVMIKTGEYSFRFDKKHWNSHWGKSWGSKADWISEREAKGKEGIVKMPWQIIPIWTELGEQFNHTKGYNVNTSIRHQSISKLEKDVISLFDDPQLLLFLRSESAIIHFEGTSRFVLEKKKTGATIELFKNGSSHSHWLKRVFAFEVDQELRDKIENDIRIPNKLRNAKRTEIAFAAIVSNGRIKSVPKENRIVYTYLPTSVNYDFPFLVNASFLTDAGRQHLHEDLYWNQWLFEQIPLRLFTWISEIAESEYREDFLKLVPGHLSLNKNLSGAFEVGYKAAIRTIKFIPNKQGKLMSVRKTLFDETGISKFLEEDILIRFINFQRNTNLEADALIPRHEPVSKLKSLGVEFFEINEIKTLFKSPIFKNSHKLIANIRLIKFLYELSEKKSEGRSQRVWRQMLRSTPFIFDENKVLKSPKEIFFPAVEFSEEFKDDISIIHPVILKIQNSHEIKKWLEKLGVREPTEISFIEKSIIGSEGFVSFGNAVEVGRYVFKAYKKGLLTDEHFADLKTMFLLTKSESLIQAQDAYLSDYYKPDLELENLYHDNFYVSGSYVQEGELISEWKSFFIKLSVSDSINWKIKRYTRDELSRKYPEHFSTLPSGAPNQMYGFKNDFTDYDHELLSFIESATSYRFAVRFWKTVLDDNLEIKTDKIDTGISYYNRKIDSLNDWIIKHCYIYPTTKKTCLKADMVYSSQIPGIRDIAGKYLPVFDYDGTIPERWLNYLPLIPALKLDDYLHILESIAKDNHKDTPMISIQSRVSQIYDAITKGYMGYTERLQEWGASNEILAKGGKGFYAASSLSVVTVKGFKSERLAFCNEADEAILELMRLFGVRVVDKVMAEISDVTIQVEDFKNHLLNTSPLIALVSIAKSAEGKDWETELKKLRRKVSSIDFYETAEIWLSYGDDQDQQAKSVWYEVEKLYYVGNWYKPRVLDNLSSAVSDFLYLKNIERDIYILLSDSFEEGKKYILEKYGEDILKILPESIPTSVNINMDNIVVQNRPYNPSDKELGRKGELFVYEQLKRMYAEKHKADPIETQKGFKIKKSVKVKWRNKYGESSFDHDFKIEENGETIYLDSKATPYDMSMEKIPFYLSPNEFRLMASSDHYYIARVFKVTSEPEVVFIKMEERYLA